MDENDCDYCGNKLSKYFNLRAVAVDDGKVVVKAWCGSCEVPDDIDPEADEALTTAFDPKPTELGT